MTEPSYPPPPPPPKSSRKTLITGLVIVVVVLAAIVGVYLLTRGGDRNLPTVTPTPSPSPTQSPSATQTPTGTGTVDFLSISDYYDDLGYYTMVGEVKNTLGTNVRYVKSARITIIRSGFSSESSLSELKCFWFLLPSRLHTRNVCLSFGMFCCMLF